jgi:hypothetical protein
MGSMGGPPYVVSIDRHKGEVILMQRGQAWRKAAAMTWLACVVGAAAITAAPEQPVPVKDRVRGASSVVVGKASAIAPEWRQNSRGDRIIVSRVELEVEETLKGAPVDVRWLDLEGGTLDGVTLHVSDLPTLKPGERAVFFLDGEVTSHKPHLRGQGILKLDAQNVVRGSSLRLDEVRRMANELRGGGR